MSAAWEGYTEDRRRSRRGGWRRRYRHWRVTGAAGILLLATGLLIAHCQAPGGLFTTAPAPGTPLVSSLKEPDLPAATLVVYNLNDPSSRELAGFYAEKRVIPAAQVVGLRCPDTEEISREEYDDTIANPLRAVFDERGWWTRSTDRAGAEPASEVTSNRIRFVALMRGMPLKIRPAPAYAGDPGNTQPAPVREQNAACVDSELAVLGYFTRAISGILANPYFRAYSRITDAPYPRLMLVTRLDAPTPSMVRRMITDSLAAEKTGLWGRCYLDSRGFAPGASPYSEGDGWIAKVHSEITPRVMPTIIDQRPEVFSREYPMTEVALYFGWYAENMTGPFTRPEFRFQPGAVACHLHSFSALSVRDPVGHWVGPLLDRGAAATVGNVYEPYLSLTTHFDVLAARLVDGFTLAESAYAATPGVSWMNTVVGDPLYRPGKVWQDLAFDLGDGTSPVAGDDPARAAIIAEGRAYWRGAQTWRSQGPIPGGKVLEKSGRALKSGRVFEGLGLLRAAANDGRGACAAFDQALLYYKDPADGVRVTLDKARVFADGGQSGQAIDWLRRSEGRFAGRVEAAALGQMEADLGAKP